MVLLAGAACVLTPFLITGMFRVLPGAVPTAVPFVAVGFGAGLALRLKRHRPVAVGVLTGVFFHGGLLLWLFGAQEPGLLG